MVASWLRETHSLGGVVSFQQYTQRRLFVGFQDLDTACNAGDFLKYLHIWGAELLCSCLQLGILWTRLDTAWQIVSFGQDVSRAILFEGDKKSDLIEYHEVASPG